MNHKFFIITLLFLLVLTFHSKVNCQNLIVNPGFEEYTKCPRDKLNNHLAPHGVKGWDYNGQYWNKCGIYYKEPHSGSGVAELNLFCQTPFVRGVGMVGTLSSTLVKDQCYYFEMYVCLSNHYEYGVIAIDAFCVGFIANNKIKLSDTIREGQIYNPKGKIITDTLNWTKISGYFKANGNEKYIIIGEFKTRKEVNFQIIRPYKTKKEIKKNYKTKSFNNAVYYIDDLLLRPVSDSLYSSDSCHLIKPIMKNN